MEELFKETLLPIVGGFLFVVCNYRMRFLALRTSGEKLILICAVLGILFAVAANVLTFACIRCLNEEASNSVHELREHLSPYPVTQLVALSLGPVFGVLLNFLPGLRRDESLTKALRDVGDQLEALLDSASRRKKKVMLTLRSGKVYVGYITKIVPHTLRARHLCLLPLMSGHRSTVKGDGFGLVQFTTFYEEIADLLLQLPAKNKEDQHVAVTFTATAAAGGRRAVTFDPFDMGILLPIDQIQQATLFDSNVYAFLNRHREPDRWNSMNFAPADYAQIDPSDKRELEYWSLRFLVPEQELKDAMAVVGTSLDAIEAFLKVSRDRGAPRYNGWGKRPRK